MIILLQTRYKYYYLSIYKEFVFKNKYCKQSSKNANYLFNMSLAIRKNKINSSYFLSSHQVYDTKSCHIILLLLLSTSQVVINILLLYAMI